MPADCMWFCYWYLPCVHGCCNHWMSMCSKHSRPLWPPIRHSPEWPMLKGCCLWKIACSACPTLSCQFWSKGIGHMCSPNAAFQPELPLSKTPSKTICLLTSCKKPCLLHEYWRVQRFVFCVAVIARACWCDFFDLQSWSFNNAKWFWRQMKMCCWQPSIARKRTRIWTVHDIRRVKKERLGATQDHRKNPEWARVKLLDILGHARHDTLATIPQASPCIIRNGIDSGPNV